MAVFPPEWHPGKTPSGRRRRWPRATSKFETTAWSNGFTFVAGVDEAGRGPLAGPLVAGAVILFEPVKGLDDSKRLTPEVREALFAKLTAGNHCFGVGRVDHDELDRIGLQPANYLAMDRAVRALACAPDFLLVDGFSLPGCAIPHTRIVKGDRLSCSIAAASIIAKVTRDRLMDEYDRAYPEYGFAKHKGYATREHVEAIERAGPCPIHRRTFAPFAQYPETDMLF